MEETISQLATLRGVQGDRDALAPPEAAR